MAAPDKAMPWMEVTNIMNRQVAFLKEKALAESNAMIAAGPETKAKGLKFLEDNAALPGVTRLTNGVEYKVVKEGDGVMPGGNDTVTVTLAAQLIDGSEIGTLSHRELPVANLRPLPLALGSVLTTMKAGSHWIIYVPYDLAYGDKPSIFSALRPPRVPPYSVVVFDVELEAVRPGAAPAAAPPMGRGGPPMSGTPGPAQPPIMHPPAIPTMPPAGSAPPQTSSDIVRVPSAEELKRGSNIEVMTLDQAIKRSQTNPPNNP
jgi:FKBP-type peptidyl-prolyl cis-trans isomerase